MSAHHSYLMIIKWQVSLEMFSFPREKLQMLFINKLSVAVVSGLTLFR